MDNKFTKWLRENYKKVVTSIAFFPAIIALVLLLLSIFMQEFDFSEIGKRFKAHAAWISLQDASTARSIVSTIAGGIISLTVFSFSMVMIVLNQAASQMTNRILDSMIANRFQQFVLGFYIGTIIYALSLLTTIRDIDSGIYVPALSIYLLLIITVADIFIFIYFLHYVTQSVKFQTIIKRVHEETMHALKKPDYHTPSAEALLLPTEKYHLVCAEDSGYFQGFNKKRLAKFARENNGVIQFLWPGASYLLAGTPLLKFYTREELPAGKLQDMLMSVDFYHGESLETNPDYGFHQLAEVAIKALSPGINDPQTAVFSLHALADLFSYRMHHPPKTIFEDEDGIARVQTMEWSFEQLFEKMIYPIWFYGKSDHFVQNDLLSMVEQLKYLDNTGQFVSLFEKLRSEIKKEIAARSIPQSRY